MGWVTEHQPDRAGLSACVQCGLCLPVCPTFRLTGRETASPRGRLQAMVAVADGHADVDAKFDEILGFCLGCRACEPVCPGMVPYGHLLEGARAEIAEQLPSSGRRLRRWLLGRVVPSRSMLRLGTLAVRVIRALHATRLVPARFRRSLSGIRELGDGLRVSRGEGIPGTGAIGLLVGCVQDEWFPSVNVAARALLIAAGFEVVVPADQTCCGALAAHDGHASVADRLGEVNDRAFDGCERVVATAAGCSAHIRDRLGPSRGVDITTVIAEAIEQGRLPSLDRGSVDVIVQDPCHLRHAQRSIDAPRAILRAGGYRLVELDDDGMCCGAAGLYTVLQPEASEKLGRQKADRIRSKGPELVASANPGCEMQLRAFLGGAHRVAHPIELYLEALEAAGFATNVPALEAADE